MGVEFCQCLFLHLLRLLATTCKELTHWKRLWCWEGFGAEEKGTTEDEIAGCHHRLNGREFEWTPGVGDGQGGLACCDSWGCKESDTPEWLNWTDWDYYMVFIFQFVSMVYHIDWFAYIEESLQPWNNPNLIIVCDLLMCCWILFARILLMIFAS